MAVVHPHPSISGTPAVGQKLTCQSGVSSTNGVRLAYPWLRDLVPIAEASSSTYTPKGVDSGGHLQCRVTATNGGGSATATSSFVTIPPSRPLVSSGETAVGTGQLARRPACTCRSSAHPKPKAPARC